MSIVLSTRPAVAAAAVALVAALFASSQGVEGGCVADCQRFDGGSYFTCALTGPSSNNVRCFGRNLEDQLGNSSYGALGYGSIASPMPPQDVDLNGARAVQVATGIHHTCVLTATGGVRCWGRNWNFIYGRPIMHMNQLGYGSSPPASPPHATDVEFDSPNIAAVQVVVGSWHSCVLLINGRVNCFGFSSYGLIGSSNREEKNSPPIEKKIYIQMPNNDKVKQICAGRDHVCALSLQGEVACWGNTNNGRLGYPNGRSLNGYVSLTTNSSLKATKVACGRQHTAVLLENGKVKTFGANSRGQLGYSYSDSVGLNQVPSYYRPENGYEDEFVRLYASNDSIVRDIACGDEHTCVIDDNDQLFCFGRGDFGQLGYGNGNLVGGEGRTQPFEAGVVDVEVESVELGELHTCIQYKTSLDMKCFGQGSYGVLGSGSLENLGDESNETSNQLASINLGASPMSPSSCSICNWTEIFPPTLSPTKTPTPSPTISTTAFPTPPPTRNPTPGTNDSQGVAVGCVADSKRFDGGYYFTCTLTSATFDNVRCFGLNNLNQLGDSSYGSNNERTASPMPPQDVDLNGARAVQISTGNYHACVITAAGGVRCWGWNTYNQLGSPLTASPPHATDIQFDSPNLQAIQVVSAWGHSCVLLFDGRVSCFGRNNYGQIGSSNSSEKNSPPNVEKIYIQMPNNATVKQICAGREHSCALSLQGEVACWGYNYEGQLGYPNGQSYVWNPSLEGFVNITTNSTLRAVKIACGSYHTAVLLENGKVKTFGRNHVGQLGYSYSVYVGRDQVPSYYRAENGYEDEFVRLHANNDSIVRDIACGGFHTCVIDSQDQLFCFGRGSYGRLGYGNQAQVGGVGYRQPFEAGVVDVDIDAVELGSYHTCIQYKNSLDMKCFGIGSYGVLGSGSLGNLGDESNETPNQLVSINLGVTPMCATAFPICEWNGDRFTAPTLSPTLSPTRSPTRSPTESPTNSFPTTLPAATSFSATTTTEHTTTHALAASLPDAKADHSSVSAGVIIGIGAVGIVMAVCALCAVGFFLSSRRRKAKRASSEHEHHQSAANSSASASVTAFSPHGKTSHTATSSQSSTGKRRSRQMYSNRRTARVSMQRTRLAASNAATGSDVYRP